MTSSSRAERSARSICGIIEPTQEQVIISVEVNRDSNSSSTKNQLCKISESGCSDSGQVAGNKSGDDDFDNSDACQTDEEKCRLSATLPLSESKRSWKSKTSSKISSSIRSNDDEIIAYREGKEAEEEICLASPCGTDTSPVSTGHSKASFDKNNENCSEPNHEAGGEYNMSAAISQTSSSAKMNAQNSTTTSCSDENYAQCVSSCCGDSCVCGRSTTVSQRTFVSRTRSQSRATSTLDSGNNGRGGKMSTATSHTFSIAKMKSQTPTSKSSTHENYGQCVSTCCGDVCSCEASTTASQATLASRTYSLDSGGNRCSHNMSAASSQTSSVTKMSSQNHTSRSSTYENNGQCVSSCCGDVCPSGASANASLATMASRTYSSDSGNNECGHNMSAACSQTSSVTKMSSQNHTSRSSTDENNGQCVSSCCGDVCPSGASTNASLATMASRNYSSDSGNNECGHNMSAAASQTSSVTKMKLQNRTSQSSTDENYGQCVSSCCGDICSCGALTFESQATSASRIYSQISRRASTTANRATINSQTYSLHSGNNECGFSKSTATSQISSAGKTDFQISTGQSSTNENYGRCMSSCCGNTCSAAACTTTSHATSTSKTCVDDGNQSLLSAKSNYQTNSNTNAYYTVSVSTNGANTDSVESYYSNSFRATSSANYSNQTSSTPKSESTYSADSCRQMPSVHRRRSSATSSRRSFATPYSKISTMRSSSATGKCKLCSILSDSDEEKSFSASKHSEATANTCESKCETSHSTNVYATEDQACGPSFKGDVQSGTSTSYSKGANSTSTDETNESMDSHSTEHSQDKVYSSLSDAGGDTSTESKTDSNVSSLQMADEKNCNSNECCTSLAAQGTDFGNGNNLDMLPKIKVPLSTPVMISFLPTSMKCTVSTGRYKGQLRRLINELPGRKKLLARLECSFSSLKLGKNVGKENGTPADTDTCNGRQSQSSFTGISEADQTSVGNSSYEGRASKNECESPNRKCVPCSVRQCAGSSAISNYLDVTYDGNGRSKTPQNITRPYRCKNAARKPISVAGRQLECTASVCSDKNSFINKLFGKRKNAGRKTDSSSSTYRVSWI